MGGGAGLYTDQAGRKLRHRLAELRACHALCEHGLAVTVHAVELKHIFCQVDEVLSRITRAGARWAS
jgi:hypothetical protein